MKGPLLKFPYQGKSFHPLPKLFPAFTFHSLVNQFDEVVLIGGGAGMYVFRPTHRTCKLTCMTAPLSTRSSTMLSPTRATIQNSNYYTPM